MPTHALHSPNISKAELKAYHRSRAPLRNRNSLIEMSQHDPRLIRFLKSPMSRLLVQEFVYAVESIVDVPCPNHSEVLPTPPITPIGRFNPVGRQVAATTTTTGRVPPHLRVNFKLLWYFIVDIIGAAKVKPADLAHSIVMIDRLKQALPHMSLNDLSVFGIVRDPSSPSNLLAGPCTHHRIALATMMTSYKYLNDAAHRNTAWHKCSSGIFDKDLILELEIQFVLRIVDFKLFVSERDLINRFYMHIYPPNDPRSRMRPESYMRIVDYIQTTAPALVTPLTPISPVDPGTQSSLPVQPVPVVVEQPFILQPVPTEKKRGPKRAASPDLASTAGLPSSQASWCLALPAVGSNSSEALLSVVNSYSMTEESTLSSSNTGTSMTSTSTGVSVVSSVRTPVDHATSVVPDSASQSSSQGHRHRRSSICVLDGSDHAKVMTKFFGLGRTLPPVRRSGFIRGRGARTVSEATIVPDNARQ